MVDEAASIPETPPKASRWRIALHIGFAIASLAAVVLLLGGGDGHRVAQVRDAIVSIGPTPFAIGALGTLVLVWIQALRWRVIARTVLPMSVADLSRAILLGQMLNTVLPARAGDLLRVQYLSDRLGSSSATILGTEIADIWIDKCGWVPVLAFFAFVGGLPSWLLSGSAILAASVVVFAVLAYFARKFSPKSLSPLAATWNRISSAATACGMKSLLGPGLLLATLGWVYEALLIVVVARTAGITLSPAQAFAVLTALNVALVAPTPGHIGAYEAATVFAMTSFGVPTAPATAFAIVYHASQLVVYVGGGLLVSLLGARPLRTNPRMGLRDRHLLDCGCAARSLVCGLR